MVIENSINCVNSWMLVFSVVSFKEVLSWLLQEFCFIAVRSDPLRHEFSYAGSESGFVNFDVDSNS